MSPEPEREAARTALAAAGRGFGTLAGGQMLIKLLAFAFGLWVLRRLGSEDFGRYSAALAFAALFGLATGPGAASFGARELASGRAVLGRFVSDLCALRVTLGLLAAPAVVLVAWGLGRQGEALLAVGAAALGLPLFALINTLDAALISQGRLAAASACAALRQALFVVFGAAALLLGGGALALLAAALLALAVRAAVTLVALARVTGMSWERPDPRRFPALARTGWHFGVEAIADIVALQLPTAALALCASDREVGCFAASFGLVQAALPLTQAAGVALVPVLNASGARAVLPRVTGRGLRWAVGAGLASALPVALLAGPLATLALGPTYAGAIAPLQTLTLALPLLFAGEVLRAALFALRGEAGVARLALTTALVVAASMALFGPWLGALGAALAYVLARLTSVAGLALLLTRTLGKAEARVALGLRDARVVRA